MAPPLKKAVKGTEQLWIADRPAAKEPNHQLTIGVILMDQAYQKIISAWIFMQKHEALRQFNLICLPYIYIYIYCQFKI